MTMRILFTALTFLFCGILSAQISQITYSADGLSGELQIRKADYLSANTYEWIIEIPTDVPVRVTRINNKYLHPHGRLYGDDGILMLNQQPIGESSTLIQSQSGELRFVMPPAQPTWIEANDDPVLIIRFSAVSNSDNSGTTVHYGNIELRNSGILRAAGYQNFMGSQVSAILGADFRSYTTFGSSRGGRIRGSDQGFLVLEGNPNGWGAPRVYINRFVPHGHVIMTGASGRVGLGIDHPLEKLHIGGAVRGDGDGGALRVRTQHGELSIGAQNNHGAHFTTNRSQFIFNQPILTTEVRIKSIDNFPDYVFEEGYYLRSLSNVNK